MFEKGNQINKGRTPWNKGGGKYTVETIKKMSESHIGVRNIRGKNKKKFPESWFEKQRMRVGEKSGHWKGGISKDLHGNSKNIKWRSNVFERDNWTCQTCRVRGCYLEAHHIKSWAKYPDLRYDLDNGVTLCLDCHKLTDNYKGRNK